MQRARALAGRMAGLSSRERAAVAVLAVAVGACLAGLWLFLTPSPAAQQQSDPDAGAPLRVVATPAGGTSPDTPRTIRIVAPAAGIDVPVHEGDGIHVPLDVALHYPGTAEPGMGSNSLFYAHAQPGMFLGLFSLHPGDAVTFERSDGSQLLYHVTGTERVPWDDLDVLRPTAFEQATLLTCTSYDPHTPRLIVTASPA